MQEKLLTTDVANNLAPKELPEGLDDNDANAGIKAADGRADSLKFMDPSSQEYARGLVKVKAAIANTGVILQEETETLKDATVANPATKQAEVKGTP